MSSHFYQASMSQYHVTKYVVRVLHLCEIYGSHYCRNTFHVWRDFRSLSDRQWYSFNDQSVTRITRDDIRKVYGGSCNRGIFSSSYTSSTNAYMLMYRKIDPDMNDSELSPTSIVAIWAFNFKLVLLGKYISQLYCYAACYQPQHQGKLLTLFTRDLSAPIHFRCRKQKVQIFAFFTL